MKKIIYLSILLFTVLCSSCEYDNYEAPSLLLKGKLVYNSESFQFDGNPDRGLLRVFQSGFGKVDVGTNIRVNESGEFQQLLFAGNYTLTPNNNQYPFEFKEFASRGAGLGYDSLKIDLKSNLEKNIEVLPYYTIKNLTTTLVNGNIVMKFDVAKTTGTTKPAPKVIRARCYVATAAAVNSKTSCTAVKTVDITDQGNVEITVSLATGNGSYRKTYINNFRTYAFCRVAIELQNIPNYYLFSETQKIVDLPL